VRRLLKSSALWAGLALLFVIGVVYAVYAKFFAPSTGAAVLKKLGLTGGPDAPGTTGGGGSRGAERNPADDSAGDVIVSLKGFRKAAEAQAREWGVIA
jgi:hypothetical protein